jgi:hypothetical protein
VGCGGFDGVYGLCEWDGEGSSFSWLCVCVCVYVCMCVCVCVVFGAEKRCVCRWMRTVEGIEVAGTYSGNTA